VAEILWRLAWALPLVLALGVAAAWALGRLGAARAPRERGPRLRVLESVNVSEGLRIHLLEVDRRTVVVAESAQHALQLDARLEDLHGARSPERHAAGRWRRLSGKAAS
jgi:flagellar biogenesis protein FliO